MGQGRSCRIAVGASGNRRRCNPSAALVGTLTTQIHPEGSRRSMIRCIVERKSARSVAGPGACSGPRTSSDHLSVRLVPKAPRNAPSSLSSDA